MYGRWLVVLGVGGCDLGSVTEKVTSKVVGTTVEVGKGVIEGAASGVAEGREGQQIDGTRVLTTVDAIRETLDFEVVSVGPTPSGPDVVLAVINDTDELVRIGGLSDEKSTLAIDAGGFATPMVGSPGHLLGEAIDVPAHAKVKVTLKFQPSDAPIAKIRIAGEEIPVP